MTSISFPTGKRQMIENWCIKNISPRVYWIHNRQGGVGWHISENCVKLEDEKKAVFLILACL